MDTLAVYLAPEYIVDNLKLRLTKIPTYLDREEDIQEWAVDWINRNYPVIRPVQADGSNSGSFFITETNENGDNIRYGWNLVSVGEE